MFSNTSMRGFPEANLVSTWENSRLELCQNFRLGESFRALVPLPIPRSPWTQTNIKTILRKVHFNSATPVAPAEPSDLNCLVARRQLECEAGFPGIHPRTVLWSHSIWEVLEFPPGLNCPAEGILEGGIPQLPTWENLHGLEIPLPS